MSKCTNEASSSEIHFESSFKNEAVANFQKLLLQDLDFVEDSFEAVKNKASQVIVEVNQARNEFEELMMLPEGRTEERDFKLHQLKKKVSKLKFAIPFSLIAPSEQPNPNIKWRHPELDLYQVKDRSYPNMNYGGNYYYNDDDDDGSPNAMYSDLKSAIWRLNLQQRWLLSCLLLFPKNLYIKRSIIFCWVKAISMTGFNFITHAIDELIERHLILAVYKKSNLAAAGYKIHPFVHSTLISNTSWHTGCSPRDMYLGHSVAVEEEDIYYTTQSFEDSVPTNNTRILYLGRWNMSTQQHIEVINPKLFFKEMSKLARLTFVSLRGISMIEELPEFITTLKWLKTLDLKACHNLEVIPSSISNLRHSLVRLDISECYLLDHIPKALGTLVKLKVLKGFLVGENKERSCTLEDLVNLQQLEKLNVYTSMEGFPNKSQFTTLQNFGKLRSLTISWGGCSVLTGPAESRKEDKYDDSKSKYTEEHPSHKENRLTEVESSKTAGAPLKKLLTLKEKIDGEHGTLSFSIEKLDLQCVPETVTCRWLKPTNFKHLKKLYIRGGKFFDLGRLPEEHQWSVEILRLKHLSKLKIDWDELQRLFPKLICLEKVKCPNLDKFPCDDSGLWYNGQF